MESKIWNVLSLLNLIPFFVPVIGLVGMMGARLLNMFVAVGWVAYARIVRGSRIVMDGE